MYSFSGSPIYSISWAPDSDQVLFTNGRQLIIKSMQANAKPTQVKHGIRSVVAFILVHQLCCLSPNPIEHYYNCTSICTENEAEGHCPGPYTFQEHSGYTHQVLGSGGSGLCWSALASVCISVCDMNAPIIRMITDFLYTLCSLGLRLIDLIIGKDNATIF